MRTPGTTNCGGCRYWSEMIAKSRGSEIVAMCLGEGELTGKYTHRNAICSGYAKNTAGAVDDPPNYGEAVRAEYARQAAEKHPNGKPCYAPDGTLLDENGNRSIFDDVDE